MIQGSSYRSCGDTSWIANKNKINDPSSASQGKSVNVDDKPSPRSKQDKSIVTETAMADGKKSGRQTSNALEQQGQEEASVTDTCSLSTDGNFAEFDENGEVKVSPRSKKESVAAVGVSSIASRFELGKKQTPMPPRSPSKAGQKWRSKAASPSPAPGTEEQSSNAQTESGFDATETTSTAPVKVVATTADAATESEGAKAPKKWTSPSSPGRAAATRVVESGTNNNVEDEAPCPPQRQDSEPAENQTGDGGVASSPGGGGEVNSTWAQENLPQIKFDKPEWAKKVPLKKTSRGDSVKRGQVLENPITHINQQTAENGERKHSWEKPDWVAADDSNGRPKTPLRRTQKGIAVQKGANLEIPITPSLHHGEHDNKEVQKEKPPTPPETGGAVGAEQEQTVEILEEDEDEAKHSREKPELGAHSGEALSPRKPPQPGGTERVPESLEPPVTPTTTAANESSGLNNAKDEDDDERKLGWEKPEWARQQSGEAGKKSPLKSTQRGSVVKQGATLEAPITHINKEKTPAAEDGGSKLDWEKPDWVYKSPIKSQQKGLTSLENPITHINKETESGERMIGWEKPDWAVQPKLRSTKLGEAVKGGCGLENPITHVQKNTSVDINLEANPMILKSSSHGKNARLGENLAKPITHIEKDPMGDINFEANPAFVLQETDAGRSVQHGQNLAKPITFPEKKEAADVNFDANPALVLQPTRRGSLAKEKGCLQGPITHVEKDASADVNMEANPMLLKPTTKGNAVRLGENLAGPITHVPRDPMGDINFEANPEFALRDSRAGTEVVKKGESLANPITFPEKKQGRDINFVANPAMLRPTGKGDVIRKGGKITREITHINGRPSSSTSPSPSSDQQQQQEEEAAADVQ